MAVNKMPSCPHLPKYVQAAILISLGGILFGYVLSALYSSTPLSLHHKMLTPSIKSRYRNNWSFNNHASIHTNLRTTLIYHPRRRRLYHLDTCCHFRSFRRSRCRYIWKIKDRRFWCRHIWTRGWNRSWQCEAGNVDWWESNKGCWGGIVFEYQRRVSLSLSLSQSPSPLQLENKHSNKHPQTTDT